MATPIIPLAFFLLILSNPTQSLTDGFVYNGFNGTETNLTLDGASIIIKPSGALKLTNQSKNTIGHAFYSSPFPMLNKTNPSSPVAVSFSTSFVFAIVPSNPGGGGHGFAFTVSPSKQFPGAEPGHFLGIFNSSNDGNSSNHVFAVEFDTVNGFGEYADSNGNHIGINVNSMSSIASEPASYHVGNSEVMEEVDMKSGKPIQSWIEYDGVDKMVHVTISYFSIPKPSRPILSHPIDLSTVLKDSMYVGFSASTGKLSSFHYILGWSFRTNLNPYPLNNSLLPSPPREVMDSPFKLKTGAIIAVVLSVTTFVVLIFNLSINMKACSDQCLHLRRVQRRSLARSIPANSLLAPIFVDQDLTSGLSAASYQSGDLLYPAIFESKRTSLRVLLLVSYISQYLSRCHSLSGNSSALK
ncbi:hypothetical protein HHK36_032378 [Tetracentron sinense]|uniref:Legume lectin domain-containing protein n=1 Tax=Tetracentron sinense TaxID=13715 RepID=A0A835CX90_TETSI|nr:hypothetical protein HHK36_032378 [Tetracentron sinense]